MVYLLCHWNKNHNTLLCERKSPANQNVAICAFKKKHATYNIIVLTLPVKKSNTLILFGICV